METIYNEFLRAAYDHYIARAERDRASETLRAHITEPGGHAAVVLHLEGVKSRRGARLLESLYTTPEGILSAFEFEKAHVDCAQKHAACCISIRNLQKAAGGRGLWEVAMERDVLAVRHDQKIEQLAEGLTGLWSRLKEVLHQYQDLLCEQGHSPPPNGGFFGPRDGINKCRKTNRELDGRCVILDLEYTDLTHEIGKRVEQLVDYVSNLPAPYRILYASSARYTALLGLPSL